MRATILLPLLAVTGCGPVLFAEVETPKACVGLAGVAVPGAGAASGIATDLEYDLGAELPVLEEPDVEYEVRVLSLTIAAAPGTDLSGVSRVRVLALGAPGSTLPPYEVLSYVRAPDAAPTDAIVASGRANVDLGKYLEAGRLDLRAIYEGGGLPASDWIADVEGCFYVRAKVDYGSLVRP